MNVTDGSLKTSYVYDADPEAVFDAWTEASQVVQWFVCAEDPASRVEIDLRVGGDYLIHWDRTATGPKTLRGTYREIDRPRRLVFTWRWDGSEEETVVAMEFVARAGKTEVSLRHSGFTSSGSRDEHDTGWGFCFRSSTRLFP